jgi:hypothetical protein
MKKEIGMNSGKVATSYDGSIAHTCQSMYVARRVSGLDADPAGYAKIQANYRFGLYSDDKNSAISPLWAEKFTFEARNAAYNELGMSLDKSKDVDSYDLAGHQWLGKTFQKLDGKWVPVANSTKILCSLRNLETALPDQVHYARASALMVEATFTPVFSWIRAYVQWLASKFAVAAGADGFEKWLFATPTYNDCVAFWLAQEGSGEKQLQPKLL